MQWGETKRGCNVKQIQVRIMKTARNKKDAEILRRKAEALLKLKSSN